MQPAEHSHWTTCAVACSGYEVRVFTAVGGMIQIWQHRMTSCRKQPEDGGDLLEIEMMTAA
jgi:hypothetical protein